MIPQYLISSLIEKSLVDGGFCDQKNGQYRPDATAWASLVLSIVGEKEDIIYSALSRLTNDQMDDGRISLSSRNPEVFWPTPLAVMAWHKSSTHYTNKKKAIDFLLKTKGLHWEKEDNSVVGHDTSIPGWPWIEDTHSWVEPTSLALLSLEMTGYGEHKRAKAGRRLLMDRQLQKGGWNYGNTTVFGSQLRPMLESTGLALSALAVKASKEDIKKSLYYLEEQIIRISSPLSIAWGLLGLSAWQERPPQAKDLIVECLKQQKVYGPYTTTQLSLLLASLLGSNGFLNLIQ